MLKESYFDNSEVKLNYITHGQGKSTLLFLHGAGGSYLAFLQYFPQLSLQFRLVAYDFRGCGKSTHSPGTYNYKTLVKDTHELIKVVIKTPVYIFGHSLGGVIALMLAAQYPELVNGIIVGDSPLNFEYLKNNQEFLKLVHSMNKIADSDTHPLDKVTDIGEMSIDLPDNKGQIQYKDMVGTNRLFDMALYLTMRDAGFMKYGEENIDLLISEFNPKIILPNVKCPVLLIQANPSLGGIMTSKEVEMALNLLPTVYHTYIENTGHDIHEDQITVLKLITSFLNILLWSK